MKAPQYRNQAREHVHHVRTERGVSTYQIRTSAGKDAEVLATVVVSSGSHDAPVISCLACNAGDCKHAEKIRLRIREAKP